jgi:hypothetical protein
MLARIGQIEKQLTMQTQIELQKHTATMAASTPAPDKITPAISAAASTATAVRPETPPPVQEQSSFEESIADMRRIAGLR